MIMTAAPKKDTKIALEATVRDSAGKGSARALRREGKIPGILYGKGQTPISIALPLKEITMEYARGRFRSRLLDITLDGNQSVKALPKDVQFNPVTDVIEHVDFIKVEKGMHLNVSVPVHFTGQDKSLGLKRGGVLNIVRHEIEFSCDPESIPTHIEINIQSLDIGTSVHIKDLELPKGVSPVIKRNFTIATIAGRRTEEEEAKGAAAAPAAAAAAPAADKGAKKEEAKPAAKK
jgi:large subunit ribosomal protein L25